jgi:serpin B
MAGEIARRTVTRRGVIGLLGTALLHPWSARAADGVSDADRTALVTSNSDFGLDLYARLRGTAGNLFYSPWSISCALAMTFAGARAATAAEMAKALKFSLEPGRLHSAFARLIRDLKGAERKRAGELYVANALWSQTRYPFVADFRSVAKTRYGAALEEVDFAKATETARRTINEWVEKQTHDKIKDLLPEGVLDSETVLVLTNAIYLKAAWMQPFAEALTRPAEFALGSRGAIQNVPFMHRTEFYRYLDGGAFLALDLPYEGNELSMIVLLPRAVDGLANFEKTLTGARLTEWVGRMERQHVDVALPRFKVTGTFALKQPLMDLGMKQAFSRSAADFSGMVKVQRVFLSVVAHKAFVDVTERGTEAGAAAAVGAAFTSMPRPFHATHPFFFVIRDNRTGTILFAGRLANPQAT